jgi:hypothetical protein
MKEVMAGVSSLPAIRNLLELGAIKATYAKITSESLLNGQSENWPAERLIKYQATPLAAAIVLRAASGMIDMNSEDYPKVAKLMQELMAKKTPQPRNK